MKHMASAEPQKAEEERTPGYDNVEQTLKGRVEDRRDRRENQGRNEPKVDGKLNRFDGHL